MITRFGVENHLSFNEYTEVDFSPNNYIKSMRENINDTQEKWNRTLKSTVFFWWNSSWKTNLFDSIADLRHLVLESYSERANKKIDRNIFKLDINGESKKTKFELDFVCHWKKYSYLVAFNNTEVEKEKLSLILKWKEQFIFDRNHQEIEGNPKTLEERNDNMFFPRENVFFLSFLANTESKGSDKNRLSKQIYEYFENLMIYWSRCPCCNGEWHLNFPEWKSTIELLEHKKTDKYGKVIKSIMSQVGMDIIDIQLGWYKKLTLWNRDFPTRNRKVKIRRKLYDWKKIIWEIDFDLDKEESSWTKNFFKIIGPIIYTIMEWWVIMVDEMDETRHYLLTKALVNMIHDNEICDEEKPYQIIINTHSIELLDLEILRKDQIHFVERDWWATNTYSLDHFKEIQIRDNSDIVSAYTSWLFWWVPDFTHITI